MNNQKQELKLHPLIGSMPLTFIKRAYKNKGISITYLPTFIMSLSVSALLSPLYFYEKIKYDNKIKNIEMKEDPIFIIGHWRSGTTNLHNLLCLDESFGYHSTLQALFPLGFITLSKSKKIKNIISSILPKKRMMDNMDLDINLPQEEEFSLSCITANSHHCNHFPKTSYNSFKKYVLFEGLSDTKYRNWIKNYKYNVNKTYYSQKKQLVFKNPYNTARVETLIKMYPNAKFIHIYRNPYKVILSAIFDFIKEAEEMSLQNFTENTFYNLNYKLYIENIESFLNAKEKYKDNIFELRYEDLVKKPHEEIKKIYKFLNKDFNVDVQKKLEEYLNTLSDYKTNTYTISQEMKEEIDEKIGKYIDYFGYKFPEDIEINNEKKWTGYIAR